MLLRAASIAPSSAGSTEAWSRIRTPLRSAVSCAWPSRPKPVTSVTACGEKGLSACAARSLSVVIQRAASERSPFSARTRPVPSGFVRKTASPGRAPLFTQTPSGWTVPTTARPYFGSVSRIVWPPARIAPAARTCSSAPAKTAPTSSVGSSSGKAAIESARSGEPPIAKTSLSAFVAAIRPKSAGSSTSGGKKSTVKMSARSSSSLYTAASSAGESPTRRFSASTGTRPSSSSASLAAEYVEAQPLAAVRLVSAVIVPCYEDGGRSRRLQGRVRSASGIPREDVRRACRAAFLIHNACESRRARHGRLVGHRACDCEDAARRGLRAHACVAEAREGRGGGYRARRACCRGGRRRRRSLRATRCRASRALRSSRHARQLCGHRDRGNRRAAACKALRPPVRRQPPRALPRHACRDPTPRFVAELDRQSRFDRRDAADAGPRNLWGHESGSDRDDAVAERRARRRRRAGDRPLPRLRRHPYGRMVGYRE